MLSTILYNIDIIIYLFNIILTIICFKIVLNLLNKFDVQTYLIKNSHNRFPKNLKNCYINQYKDYFEICNNNHYITIYNKDLKEFLKENPCLKNIKIINKK